ncbi:zonular occludens toxin, partial [Xanthomonas perforans]|nr:zonular occludens toxin [Xanthomonas perforans]MBZ3143793.1 zonular occludens toxin [Xanthomonas perforans]MBZ3151758.1 zonular occludens toxin [Xanthomonas perforans]MBZ3156185.1 zonular occludens toxin [Xanthomonas perforans]MBZ3164753.1 zonular occludens toxin [Xanthomonas perforans]
EVHTMKYQMPALVKKALMILPVVAILAGGAWYAVYRDTMFAKKADAAPANKTAPVGPSLAGTASAGAAARPKVNTAEDYVGQLVPLVADVPWSAPAYVDRPVVSDPHMYCMSSENSCRCVTEQNTRVSMRDDVCRDIARWGEPYNPYKPPSNVAQAQQPSSTPATEQPKPQVVEQSGAVTSTIEKRTRALGTFPESPGYSINSYTKPTTRDL